MNYQQPEYRLPMVMSQDFSRKKTDREECLPVQLNDQNEVQMVAYHGSAHIHAYHQAFGYITIPAGKTTLKKGEIVDVRPL